MILPIDFTDPEDLRLVVDTIQGFVRRSIPIRFGLVPLLSTDDAAGQAKVVYHLLRTYGLSSMLSYLEWVGIRLSSTRNEELKLIELSVLNQCAVGSPINQALTMQLATDSRWRIWRRKNSRTFWIVTSQKLVCLVPRHTAPDLAWSRPVHLS